ncbi:MAG: undecaprenyl-diphosphate phosphatase [Clostridiales bacterium]|jgi:undecaprenyl-diphosphatase|nr:undecaprenyl-diphosphate phosphatase [Clostridiales bacterium]
MDFAGFFNALLLGIAQGATEFLPVSSSGHLFLLERLGIGEPSVFFNVALHLGTLAAAAVYYRKIIFERLKKPFCRQNILLIAASAFTAAVALVIKELLPGAIGGAYLPFGFAATSVVLFASESFFAADGGKTAKKKDIGAGAAIVCGIAQGIAVLPGLSRSGATIGALLFFGSDRKKAADFSFLLSMPVILGGTIAAAAGIRGGEEAASLLPSAAVGAVAAAVSGFFAVKLFVNRIKAKSMKPFAYYTLALCAVSFLLVS